VDSSSLFKYVADSLEKRLPDLKISCDNGDQYACVDYAQYYLSIESSKARHEEIQKGCDDGNKQFCHVLAKEEFNRGNISTGENKLEALCNSGEPFSCTFLGRNQLLKEMFKRKPFKPNSYLKKACALNFPEACVRLEFQIATKRKNYVENIIKLAHDEKLMRDIALMDLIFYSLAGSSPEKARELAADLCAKGVINLCYRKYKSNELSIAIINDLCESGSGEACYAMGNIERQNRNTDSSLQNYLKGCSNLHTRSCSEVSSIIERERYDYETSSKFLNLLVQTRDTSGSMGFGTSYHKQKNFNQAIPYYEVVCYLNFPPGCFLLAKVYDELKKIDEAIKYSDLACRYNFLDGCKLNTELSLKADNTEEASKSLIEGCKLKDFESCLRSCSLEFLNGEPEKGINSLKSGCGELIGTRKECPASFDQKQVAQICNKSKNQILRDLAKK